MEFRRIPEAVKDWLGDLDVFKAIKGAFDRNSELHIGTEQERLDAYKRLFDRCEDLFAYHSHNGHLEEIEDEGTGGTSILLALEGPPTAPEIMIERFENVFVISGLTTTMSKNGATVYYDADVLMVSKYVGTYHTTHSEALFGAPLKGPQYDGSSSVRKTLSANMANEWADALVPELQPIKSS